MNAKQNYYQTLSASILKKLEKRGMEAYYCASKENALKMILDLIPEHSSVTWGGSMTLAEAGITDALKNSKRTIIDRSTAKTPEETKAIYRSAFSADYYLMSSNAITYDGELVNTDGTGNRVAALIYGPDHVIVVAGMNKLVPDVNAAFARIHNVAAPMNTIRLDIKTPCQKTGLCADCKSPDTICCQTVVTRYSRIPGRIKVILVGEELGY